MGLFENVEKFGVCVVFLEIIVRIKKGNVIVEIEVYEVIEIKYEIDCINEDVRNVMMVMVL